MIKKVILLSMALFAADTLTATTPGTRADFYEHVEGPRYPAKDHVCVLGQTLYTEVGGEVFARDIGDLTNKIPLFRCGVGAVRRIQALNPETICVETNRQDGHCHTSGFEIFVRGSSVLSVPNGNIQGYCGEKLYFTERSGGSGVCKMFNTSSHEITESNLPEGKPIFDSSGALRYVINRSHSGPQTVYELDTVGNYRLTHTSKEKNVLLGVSETGDVFEARYHAALGRWLPWVTSKSEFEDSAKCVYRMCPGSVINFQCCAELNFFTIRNGGSITYELQERSALPLVGLIKCVLPHLAGKQVISGPEFEQLKTLTEFLLVTVDSMGQLDLLHISRSASAGEEATVRDLGAFQL